MNLIKSTCALFIAIASVSSNIEAAAVNSSNETANISIKQMVMPQTAKSGFVSCHNTLANCLVTLGITNPNQGSVTILNSSPVVALGITATTGLPTGISQTGVPQPNVPPVSACAPIAPGEVCTLIFEVTSAATPGISRNILIQGTNTTKVYFDMEVIP